jgi:predicted hydrocarbon binding protein
MPDAPPFRDRLIWDASSGEIRDGAIRYMMIRPDALMGIFGGLDEPARTCALEAFRRSIAKFGARSASTYQADAHHPLIETVARTAPDLGWGTWSIDRTADAIQVIVRNSPFAAGCAGADGPVCTPIAGMLEAVGRLMGRSGVARETNCAAQSGDHCTFEVMP